MWHQVMLCLEYDLAPVDGEGGARGLGLGPTFALVGEVGSAPKSGTSDEFGDSRDGPRGDYRSLHL